MLTQQDIKEIIEDYKNGKPILDITQKWNINSRSMYYHLEKYFIPKRKPGLSKEKVIKILEDYKNNLPIAKIAEKYKINKFLIYYYLNKMGVRKRRKRNFYRKADIRKIISCHKAGWSLERIAKLYNISRNAVYNILKRRGFKFEIKRALPEKVAPQIISMYTKGLSICQLAKKYKVSESPIRCLLRKHKIPTRNHLEAKKLKRKKIKTQIGMTIDKARLLGLLLSDGSQSGKIHLIHNSEDNILLGESMRLVKRVYGITGEEIKNKRDARNVWTSISMVEDLRKYVLSIVHRPGVKTHIPHEIMQNSKFSREFLKYYFSSDGCIILGVNSFNNIRRMINLESRNLFLLKEISLMLNKLSIQHHTSERDINISSKDNIIKFQKLIGFLPGVVISKKSNHWVGCEKAKLLDLAIKTFDSAFPKKFSKKEFGYVYLKKQYKKLYGGLYGN